MIGFFFAGKHSREFWMAMEDADRPLLPKVRRNDYEIAGRHGTVNFGGKTYATRQIPVDIAFISDNIRNLQIVARDIALWLSGRGTLYFDDEPERGYDAVVYEPIDTEHLIRAKRASVIFECQPFAKTIHHLQSDHSNIQHGNMMTITSNGTQATPVIIRMHNTGNINIHNIRISRRAMRL